MTVAEEIRRFRGYLGGWEALGEMNRLAATVTHNTEEDKTTWIFGDESRIVMQENGDDHPDFYIANPPDFLAKQA